MQFSTLALSALLGVASAQKVHVVSVGSKNGSLTFMPDNMKAAAGDMVQFQFRGGNHSVVQSTFDNPCSPISNQMSNVTGIFSGYQPVKASEAMGMIPTYTVMVKDTKPMWFYCSQGKHCQAGMTMVLNENTQANATRSLAEYKKLAKAATANTAPATPAGGSAGGGNGTGAGAGGSTGGGSGGGSTGGGAGGSTGGGSSSGGSSTSAAAGGAATASSTATPAPVTASAPQVVFSSTLAGLAAVAGFFALA